jgi:ABC-type transport system involved in multi-copper enzyme maturation permease subunit
MTLLSKPITRRQFIIGKFLGIIQAAAIMIVPLTIIFCLLLFYKVGYDARESSETVPDVMDFQTMTINQQRLEPVVKTLPGVVLIFLEICVLTAISVAISTRAPMVVNIVSCLAIFVVGHLTPVLVHAGVLKIEFVQFMARLIATILPSLEVFNIQAAVATDRMIPPNYISTSAAYSVCYCAAAILLAFILFEDRDLA